MPNDLPSNLPDDTPPLPNDRDDAASVLARTGQDKVPGGGGLIGSGETAPPAKGGAATPNSPIDIAIPGDGDAEAEARARSLAEDPAAPR